MRGWMLIVGVAGGIGVAGCDGDGCNRGACGKQACSCFDYLDDPQDKDVAVCVSTVSGSTSYSLEDEDGSEVFSCEDSTLGSGDCSLQLMEAVIATCSASPPSSSSYSTYYGY
ncbi:MAG: hypothetical protein ABMA64_07790 [Myxococcota bacterium]